MDKETLNYREAELYAVCPLPVNFEEDVFKIQIRSRDGRATKWLNINGEEFKRLEILLLNGYGA